MKYYKLIAVFITIVLLCGCQKIQEIEITKGVSSELAKHRSDKLSDVKYDLFFSIPDSVNTDIKATESIHFQLSNNKNPLFIDFCENTDKIVSVKTNGIETDYEFQENHIIIPKSFLNKGNNEVFIEFIAGDKSLNRNQEYLYTLFVPDRASTAFPCFDQPDIKANFILRLETPEGWLAVANGKLSESEIKGNRISYIFSETKPISTYLFSFVAGSFEVITKTKDGLTISMYHKETDKEKIEQNTEIAFDLHFSALKWLEEYTGIPYPFEKFDFVLIPSFQYGGMEHPGAILYRDSRILLEESATLDQKLGRASLISHESSHMWFGDLVTMKWFDDVWLKEVFANFIADKIVNPNYPEINHELRFLLGHYPGAYSVDRSLGANPIGQVLDNLKDAGSLYGGIIYHKAPVVMNHLEKIMGKEKLQEGLREYLSEYLYGSATWDDLIKILDKRINIDLGKWSDIWVYEAGMPEIIPEIIYSIDKKITSFRIKQEDPFLRGRNWSQNINMIFSYDGEYKNIHIHLENEIITVDEVNGWDKPDFILINGSSTEYGFFMLDDNSLTFLLQNMGQIKNDLIRGTVCLNMYENMLRGVISPQQYIQVLSRALEVETNQQIISVLLRQLQTTYWKFSNSIERNNIAPRLEKLLWDLLSEAESQDLKSTYFRTYRSIAISSPTVQNLYDIWKKDVAIKGLNLSENDYTTLAYELAVRDINNIDKVLKEQLERISNPDRKKKMQFIIPALSKDQSSRDNFFNSLQDEKNRHVEPWVTEALRYFHHPLRGTFFENYIYSSLEMLEEIQETGDIFFPKQWLDATLGGHNSLSAANSVLTFLEEHQEYPDKLRNKIIQSADLLLRSVDLITK